MNMNLKDLEVTSRTGKLFPVDIDEKPEDIKLLISYSIFGSPLKDYIFVETTEGIRYVYGAFEPYYTKELIRNGGGLRADKLLFKKLSDDETVFIRKFASPAIVCNYFDTVYKDGVKVDIDDVVVLYESWYDEDDERLIIPLDQFDDKENTKARLIDSIETDISAIIENLKSKDYNSMNLTGLYREKESLSRFMSRLGLYDH